ncbi:6551_t:CDS:2 [Scutellospora calospora]|uniref:6551_t:CDS:1 n=1 Tax=Scutellospora calospora TaxID=85575 RepID=A0ACA9JYV5_9GLOM|nr:6551_t:CDS:2 [Scutellospora calospora]
MNLEQLSKNNNCNDKVGTSYDINISNGYDNDSFNLLNSSCNMILPEQATLDSNNIITIDNDSLKLFNNHRNIILPEQAPLAIDIMVIIDDDSIDLFNSSHNIILSEQVSSTSNNAVIVDDNSFNLFNGSHNIILSEQASSTNNNHVIVLEHNHLLDFAAVIFDFGHYRLSSNESIHIQMLYNSSVLVSTIVNMLTIQYSRYIHNKDIYNSLSHHSYDYVKGLSQTTELLNNLNNNNEYQVTYSVNNDKLHYLFFTTRSALSMFKHYPEILSIDSTYKMNQFGMPLLLVTGVDMIGITFFIDKTFYDIQTVITDADCALISNLIGKFKNKFTAFSKDFKVVMFETTEKQFNVRWDCLLSEYPEEVSVVISDFVYVLLLEQYNVVNTYDIKKQDNSFVQVYRACWVIASAGFTTSKEQNNFINNFNNFNKSTTELANESTTESTIESITDFITESTLESTTESTTKFNDIIYNISSNQQRSKSTTDLLKDIKNISNRVGHVEINNTLTLFVEQLNQKYLLSQEDISDPIIAKTKERPSSTKRMKTDTEQVTKKLYVCSICSGVGHNSQSCPRKVQLELNANMIDSAVD